MQGFERADRQLTDVAALAGHLIPAGSMFALLAERQAEVFPDEDYADLFAPRGSGRPSVSATQMAAVMTLQARHDYSRPGKPRRPPPRWRCWPWWPGRMWSPPRERRHRRPVADRPQGRRRPGDLNDGPRCRHTRKSPEARRDGYRAHVAADPETGIITGERLTRASGEDNSRRRGRGGVPGRRGHRRPVAAAGLVRRLGLRHRHLHERGHPADQRPPQGHLPRLRLKLRGEAKNDAWLRYRTAGLRRQAGTWALAT